jgi:hypothetical protein
MKKIKNLISKINIKKILKNNNYNNILKITIKIKKKI